MLAGSRPNKKSKWRVVKWVILALVGFLVAFPILKQLSLYRESALRATCNNNLTQIWFAMTIYSIDHGDKFPQGETGAEVIAKLIEEGYLEAGEKGALYMCPGAAGGTVTWERTSVELTEEDCSYVFLAGVNADSNDKFMVAFDKSPDNHWTRFLLVTQSGRRGRNVLFADGHVSFILEDEFQQRMSWQRDMMERMEEGREFIPFGDWDVPRRGDTGGTQ